MTIQIKLAELKEMHANGLISAEVYAEQQKALLASHMNASTAPAAPPAAAVKQGWPLWQQVLVLVLVIFGGIWIAYKVTNRDGKDTINNLVARTGIGAPVIPWTDRADTAARAVLAQNSDKLATSILALSHPTGKNPSLIESSVSKLPHSILVRMKVGWKGNWLVGGDYQTVVAWEIGESNHMSAKVVEDTSPFQGTPQEKEKLDEYFRTNVYPAFYNTITGTVQ